MQPLRFLQMRDAALEDVKADEYEGHWRTFKDLLDQVEVPFTIVIDGPWGSGKTRYLRGLFLKATQSGFPAVWFSAWEYATLRSEIVPSLLHKISRNLPKDFDTRTQRALIWGGLAGAIDAAMALLGKSGGIMAAREAFNKAQLAEAEELRQKFVLYQDPVEVVKSDFLYVTDLICSAHEGKPLIIFVDDLDRLLSEEALAVLEAIKTLMVCSRAPQAHESYKDADQKAYGQPLPDRAKAMFVFAMDLMTLRSAIVARHGDMSSFADAYLNKMFAMTWKVEPVSRSVVERMLIEDASRLNERLKTWNFRTTIETICSKVSFPPEVTWRVLRYAWDKTLHLLVSFPSHGTLVDKISASVFCAALLEQGMPSAFRDIVRGRLWEKPGFPRNLSEQHGLAQELIGAFDALISEVATRTATWSQAFESVASPAGGGPQISRHDD